MPRTSRCALCANLCDIGGQFESQQKPASRKRPNSLFRYIIYICCCTGLYRDTRLLGMFIELVERDQSSPTCFLFPRFFQLMERTHGTCLTPSMSSAFLSMCLTDRTVWVSLEIMSLERCAQCNSAHLRKGYISSLVSAHRIRARQADGPRRHEQEPLWNNGALYLPCLSCILLYVGDGFGIVAVNSWRRQKWFPTSMTVSCEWKLEFASSKHGLQSISSVGLNLCGNNFRIVYSPPLAGKEMTSERPCIAKHFFRALFVFHRLVWLVSQDEIYFAP